MSTFWFSLKNAIMNNNIAEFNELILNDKFSKMTNRHKSIVFRESIESGNLLMANELLQKGLNFSIVPFKLAEYSGIMSAAGDKKLYQYTDIEKCIGTINKMINQVQTFKFNQTSQAKLIKGILISILEIDQILNRGKNTLLKNNSPCENTEDLKKALSDINADYNNLNNKIENYESFGGVKNYLLLTNVSEVLNKLPKDIVKNELCEYMFGEKLEYFKSSPKPFTKKFLEEWHAMSVAGEALETNEIL